MKNISEYTAEVLIRAKNKAKERAKKRRIALAVCAPLALALCAVMILPAVSGRKSADPNGREAAGTPAPTGSPETTEAMTETPAVTVIPEEPTASPRPTHEPMPSAGRIDLPIVNTGTVNLMEGILPREGQAALVASAKSMAAYADFAMRVFRAAEDGGNELISPVSLLCALSMTANGAEGGTLTEMEQLLGMTREELNDFWRGCCALLPGAGSGKLELANSIWFPSYEGFSVNREFLQTNADIFKADIFKAPFDTSTLEDINSWVSEKTDGMIPQILDSMPVNAPICLINALSFDAEWEKKIHEEHVHPADFKLEDGSLRTVTLMHGSAEGYLHDENAEGFIKYYAGRRYAFAALLPDEGVSVADYAASLDGQRLMSLLNGAEEESLICAIPMFETEYSGEMSQILYELGMRRAFDRTKAEFGAVGTLDGENLFIGEVLHKTYIGVDTAGTRAGAVTSVITYIGEGSPNRRIIWLDRPFIYMLIDCETNLPFFIGTLMEP